MFETTDRCTVRMSPQHAKALAALLVHHIIQYEDAHDLELPPHHVRTIDATLLTQQKTLRGKPVVQLVIGTAPNTIDLSAYLLSYDYEEEDLEDTGVSQAQLTLVLDNKSGYFNSLTGDKAYITHGADVEEELPQCWIESFSYTYEGGVAHFVIEAIDWKGRLGHHQLTTAQSWSATSATTILEWILTQVGLTRLAGSMTALTLDFDIQLLENAASALKRLVRKMPEYLYSGLDAEINWKNIDSGDASVYTFGWNADHPALNVEAGTGAWEVNSVTVNGKSGTTGSDSDATQIAPPNSTSTRQTLSLRPSSVGPATGWSSTTWSP
jgi:hypothetical protein